MRRRIVVTLALIVALPVLAAERWWDAYNRGVKAVNAGQYADAIPALQTALATTPAESGSLRVRNNSIVYLPHYWLGVAKFHLGDFDGALREWKISEDQGAIAKTEYYPKLREWVSRAQSEKKRGAADAASSSKKAADAAINAAMSAQVTALSAGADRTDGYRQAQAKLQEAMSQVRSAGTDVAAFQRARQTADTARDLFARAAEDARKQKAARPQIAVSRPAPQPVAQTPLAQPQPVTTEPPAAQAQAPPQPQPQPVAAAAPSVEQPKQEPPPAIAAPAEPSPALTSPVPAPVPVASTINVAAITSAAALRGQIESAFRFYASGDFEASERALNSILKNTRSGEAYLLRGCARYTRAMLSRTPDPILDEARGDFKAALKLNRNLRLDGRTFSPKLVAFFETVRKSS